MKHSIKINGEVKTVDCELGSGIKDKNGREIYEGDKVIRVKPDLDWDEDDFDEEKTFPMRVTFEDYGEIIGGEIVKVNDQ